MPKIKFIILKNHSFNIYQIVCIFDKFYLQVTHFLFKILHL